MTPKEKAKDLFDKYLNEIGWGNFEVYKADAKSYALLCIDEILQTNPTIKGNSEDLITMIVQTKAY